MSDYYDRAGAPIDLHTCGTRFSDMDYKRVKRDAIGGFVVSTVWLGLDHAFGGGPPLIFETMIFGNADEEYCDRYSTEAEAVEGHEKACEQARQWLLERNGVAP